MISTKLGKHGNKDKGTVPRRTPVTELDGKSNLVSTERLADGILYREIRISLGQPKRPCLRPKN